MYSTLLGGCLGGDIVSDGNGGKYVYGNTSSPNFSTTTNAFDRTFHGPIDVFIARFNATLSQLLYGSYFGGSADSGDGNVVFKSVSDRNGNIIFSGYTSSRSFPITTFAFDTSFNGGYYDCFVSKLDLSVEAVSPKEINVPQSYSLTITSWATSTRRRVR